MIRHYRCAVALSGALTLFPSASSAEAPNPPACRVQVVGFGGGHVIPEWIVMSEFAGIARAVRNLQSPDVCVRTFPGILLPVAFQWVRRSFSPDDRQLLTPGEIANGPAVIIYGYSSGGWSALNLARRLGHESIPIELVVEIDAPWFGGSVVPPNVRRAASFYERRTWWLPFLMGTARARPEDETKTEFLGNIRVPKVGHFGMPKVAGIRNLIVDAIVEVRQRQELLAMASGVACE